MTTISAKIIADSVSPDGVRLSTLLLRYPKIVHGEAKTHRVVSIGDASYERREEVGFMDCPDLSRNASSSRAIPVSRLIQDVLDDPYVPIHWGKNQRGMQADGECDELVHLNYPAVTAKNMSREDAWLKARDTAVAYARAFSEAGYHKQIVNRLLEPWAHINVVVSATSWQNFFALRIHKDAQPEIRMLAEAVKKAIDESTPKLLAPGQWHLPFVTDEDRERVPHFVRATRDFLLTPLTGLGPGALDVGTYVLLKASVARCARTSYLTHDQKPPSIELDVRLHDDLVLAQPVHASPTEHQATPDYKRKSSPKAFEWNQPNLHGNLRGWRQYRKMIPNECVPD